jgi:hypothetical protein
LAEEELALLSLEWRWAMTMIRFKVGDPVKTRASGVVPQGTTGVIYQVVLAVAGMYYVQFEGIAQPHLMQVHDLEGSGEALAPEHERTAGAD